MVAMFRTSIRSSLDAPATYWIGGSFVLVAAYLLLTATGMFLRFSLQSQTMGMADHPNFEAMVIRPNLITLSCLALLVLPLITSQMSDVWHNRRGSGLYAMSSMSEAIGMWSAFFLVYSMMLAMVGIAYVLLAVWGGPDTKSLATGFAGLLLEGAALLSIGAFVASRVRRPTTASVLMFGISALMWVPVSAFPEVSAPWSELFSGMSVLSHSEGFAKGVVQSSDLVYFVTVTWLGLFLASWRPTVKEPLDWTTDWLKRGGLHSTAHAVVSTLVLIAGITSLNWAATRYNRSFDATPDAQFTLSDETTRIVRHLPGDVNITYWDRSAQFNHAKDILGLYALSSPRIHVRYRDVEREPAAARAAGVLQQGSVVIDAHGRIEHANSLSEQDLTNSLLRVFQGDRTVCFSTGTGEPAISDDAPEGLAAAAEALRRSHVQVHEVSLTARGDVPGECQLLVIAAPRHEYSDRPLKAVAGYLEGGGRLLVLLGAPLNRDGSSPTQQKGLRSLMAAWGIAPDPDLVLDPEGVGRVFGYGPEVLLITDFGSHAITRDLGKSPVILPLACSLSLSGEATVLLSSGQGTISFSDLGRGGQLQFDPAKGKKGPFTLAAAMARNRTRIVVVGSAGWLDERISRYNRQLFESTVNWLIADSVDIPPKPLRSHPLTMDAAQLITLRLTSLFGLPLMAFLSGVAAWWRRRSEA